MRRTSRVRLITAAAVSCALLGLAGCGEPRTPTGILTGKIHGCTNVVTSGGSKQDDNTVDEGQCGLPADKYGNGPLISLRVWSRGDLVGICRRVATETNGHQIMP